MGKKRKNRKDRYSREQVKDVTQLEVLRYTWDAWQVCYPDAGRKDFDETNCSYDPYAYADMIFDRLDLRKDQTLRILTIGREYLDWLSANGLQDSLDNRMDYAGSLSDAEADRLFREDPFNTLIDVYILPVLVLVKESKESYQFRLPKGLCRQLQDYIGSFIDDDIYVPGYVLRMDDAYNDEDNDDKLFEIACVYFDAGEEMSYIPFCRQRGREGVNLLQLCVPVMVRHLKKTSVFKHPEAVRLDDREYLRADGLFFDRESLDELGFPDAPAWEDTAFAGGFAEAFGDVFVVSPFPGLFDTMDIPHISEIIQKGAERGGWSLVKD